MVFSGKRLHNLGTSPFLVDKSTIHCPQQPSTAQHPPGFSACGCSPSDLSNVSSAQKKRWPSKRKRNTELDDEMDLKSQSQGYALTQGRVGPKGNERAREWNIWGLHWPNRQNTLKHSIDMFNSYVSLPKGIPAKWSYEWGRWMIDKWV